MADYRPTDPTVAAIVEPGATYGQRAPFHPPVAYPEYPFDPTQLDPSNAAYALTREAFHQLGLDPEGHGTRGWNPLGGLIRPGDRVVLKPNAVLDHNQDASESVFASITHPSVLRAVADYCWIALEGRGEVVIADAPLMSSDFGRWRHVMQLDALQAFYKQTGRRLAVYDLRETTLRWTLGFTPSRYRDTRARDPEGYTDIDLGSRSLLAELGDEQMARAYGADYRVAETIRAHTEGRHVYRVSNTVLGADVLIVVPKLKLHKKVGVTMAIKGMVGIIGDKNTIVHHRRGAPEQGGDEYPARLASAQALFHDWRTRLITSLAARQTTAWDVVYFANEMVRRVAERVLVPADKNSRMGGGSWSGNDTAWRMGCDLLRIALYGRPGRSAIGTERRHLFAVVDGIIGGDMHGPLAPRARASGTIIAGVNPVAVDWVGARLMNVDPTKLRLLVSCRDAPDLGWAHSELPIVRALTQEVADLWSSQFHLGYRAAPGWRGMIEAIP